LAKAKSSAGAVGSAAGSTAGSTAGGADPFIYLVQAGAFRTPEDAEAQRVKLSLLGMDAKVTEREQSGRTVFRVRVGPYNNKDDAEKTKEKLDGGGFETALVRVQR
jgi:cell division protein FtsN